MNYLIRLTKAAEGGREEEFAQAAAWDGDEGVCARARLTMPSCLIPDLTSVPSSPLSLSLYLSPSPIFTIYKCSGCCRIYGAGIREWGVEERD